MLRKGFYLFISLFFISVRAQAVYTVDTLHITIEQAEKRFLDSNLTLLIGKTNIDVQKALELQARLFDNPNISYTHNFYNANTKRWFSVSSNNGEGELSAQLTQLIRIGGKRKNQVKLAQYNTQMTEYQYYDLLRALKYQLVTDLSSIDLYLQNDNIYRQQIDIVKQLVDATAYQVQSGNASEKESVRLQNVLLALQSAQRSNYESLLDAESDVKQLLKYSKNEFVVPDLPQAKDVSAQIRSIGIDSLNSIALTERYDVKAAKLGVDIANTQLRLQRAQGVPDPSLFFEYDRFGSSYTNYTGLGVSIDLPVFNHNQGNIRSAKAGIKAAQYSSDNAYLGLTTDVASALMKMLNITDMQKTFDQNYNKSFNRVSQGMIDLYKERKIGLVEFLDFFDSYGESKRNLNQLTTDYRQGVYELNYTLGKDVF
ncbi:MAG: TolC family protein [Bacteroidetes bacterium]|nr:TolC family protein [Bacteroidota bacterium]